MLTKKQLEDAARCFAMRCIDCTIRYRGRDNCVRETAQTALAYRNMLERLEYIQDEFGGHCPICGMGRGLGHMDGCELAALLKESEGEEG